MLFENIPLAKTIASLVSHGKPRQALTLFRHHQNNRPSQSSEFLFSSAARACASLAAIAQGKQLHCATVKNGFGHDVVLTTSLIDMYCKSTSIDDARKLFTEMPLKDVTATNSMISGLCRSGLESEAITLFDSMPERDVCSWNSMISGSKSGMYFFQRMMSEGVKADTLTMVSVLSICADLAMLLDGKRAHAVVIVHGFGLYLPIGNSVIDMYAKCGSMNDAFSWFEAMPVKNVVTWTAMIEGYGKQGQANEALMAFEAMESEGIKPNDVTFLGVLYACGHAGLVQEGCRIFDAMRRKYLLSPKIEHYTCVVDLLARAGRLEEACGLAESMPMKADAKLLTALLSACWWRHGNVQLAKRVGERLLEAEPREAGAYVLLSNLYGLVGDLESGGRVKRLMCEREISKETGCTWIEIRQSL